MSDDVSALLRWLHAHDLPSEVVLCCEHTPVPRLGRRRQAVVWRGCLDGASIGVVAQLLALGIERVAVAPCSRAGNEVYAQVKRWQSLTPSLVDFLGPRKRPLLTGPEPLRLGHVTIPRRVLLGLGLRDTPPYSLKADDTARTLASIELLTARGLIRRGEGIESKLGGVQLATTGCTACGVCVQACPHSALELVHDAGGSVLWQSADSCRGEQACVRLCPVDAMWVQGPTRLADLLDEPRRRIGIVESKRCGRCGARHPASDGELCQVCTFRAANPFGSVLPSNGMSF
ncbi:4Fe-4S dicluster domain-containing protein [Trueperella pecoris]|uniref:4Fe-4S dicluster domain-containing protein n=1 Tax=Trueperella pecoris TaxID=2733571 RepID=A0A7M1QX33_9ACTO|nr:4Fe-4S dicluster domain-containing protein [Trueperella pecoris]QOQ38980.1 4Fe-4S dicluster domain-containing protein [Trueperella pecoris]QOR46391.1 4Fe-4S dicluster domain-containing protein [Trueperella pecoris]QTG76216.1 4Fe-4S dicluster domain-containing protein [Trueperella pecoris]